MGSPPRKIIHIDMDAFYASIELRDDPSLAGKPVVVGSPAARGAIVAATYEARKLGVHSAMPSSAALHECPGLIFVPRRMEVYKTVSQQIQAIFTDYSDLVEPLSLDVAFLDVTANKVGIETATQTARIIRARIPEETGLTASAGISYISSWPRWPAPEQAQRSVSGRAAQGDALAQTLPISRFYGVGEMTERKMKALKILTGEGVYRQSWTC